MYAVSTVLDPIDAGAKFALNIGSSTMNANRDRANPFDDGRNLNGRAGLDLKLGVGPNLTLDATVNPDFGQVELDPAVVNLTQFETVFSERRPFFVEGRDIFTFNSGNNGTLPANGSLFYSPANISCPVPGCPWIPLDARWKQPEHQLSDRLHKVHAPGFGSQRVTKLP